MGFVWVLAVLFVLNSIGITIWSNFNTGTLLMWLISLGLVVYGIFHRKIDAFCAGGVGFVLKVLFFAGVGVYAALVVFVALASCAAVAKGRGKTAVAIIVLGAGVHGEAVGNLLRRRLEAALAACGKNPAALVAVTGGRGPQEDIPEALAMQRWLLANGMEKSRVVVEDKSRNTEENLLFAKGLLAQRGVQPGAPVAVVTSGFHCYRAVALAKKAGFPNAFAVAATISPTTWLPNYLREVLAVLKMWLLLRGALQTE